MRPHSRDLEQVQRVDARHAFRRSRAKHPVARIQDGNQQLAQAADREPAIARSHSQKHTSRAGPVDECNIPLCELHGLIVLDHRTPASDLK
jgi:hypothetical protein